MPVTSHLLSDAPWELEHGLVAKIAADLASRFGEGVNWAEVVHAVVLAVDPSISRATLDDVSAVAGYLGEDAVARWVDRLATRPELAEAGVNAMLLNHASLITLGPYVRRRAWTQNGVEERPGPWHESVCRFVARAGDVANWEGTETLSADGRLCGECRAGQPAAPEQLPLTERDRARDEIRDEISAMGLFVRRRGQDDFPPGKWHAAGCRTTRTAREARSWEGASELPVGEDACKTCLGAP